MHHHVYLFLAVWSLIGLTALMAGLMKVRSVARRMAVGSVIVAAPLPTTTGLLSDQSAEECPVLV